MIEISRIDAYQSFDEIDFNNYDSKLDDLFHSEERGNKEMTQKFYLTDDSIIVKVFFDDVEVFELSFINKGTLTDTGKKALEEHKDKELLSIEDCII